MYDRLTPAYMLCIGISAALTKYFHDGPLWPVDTGFDPNCKHSWWTNLLYINNFVKTDKSVSKKMSTIHSQ